MKRALAMGRARLRGDTGGVATANDGTSPLPPACITGFAWLVWLRCCKHGAEHV